MRTAALSTRRPKIKDLREIADGQFRFAISEVLAARAFGGHEPNARNAAPCTDVSSVLEDNAACHVCGPVDMAAFARVIDINLMGTVSVITKCAARMMALEKLNDDGERGIIINTGSITAVEGQIGQGAYVASKGAIASLTLQAAREFMPRGIRVMTIAPGLFRTPIADHIPQEVIDGMLDGRMFPNRFGEPAEFGRLVVDIVRNPMLNGEIIRLDAGVRLQAR